MPNTDTELTILMPCLNEEETLGTCIEKAHTFLKENGVSGEILIADNGSTDDSVRIAMEKGARVIHVSERGYGAALNAGCREAYGRFVIMGDSDDSYDFLHLMPFLEKLREGYDLVMGNRFKGGIERGAMPFLHRYIGNPILSMLGRLFYHSKIGDFHCGLRGYNRDRMRELNLKTTGMEYASEMVVKAEMNHYRITEVPTTLSPDGRTGAPHLRTFSDGWRHMRFLLIYSPRWLFFYPGLFLLVLGIAGMCILSAGELKIDGIRLGVHTLLFMAGCVIIGTQILFFKLLSDVYAESHDYFVLTERQRMIVRAVSVERCLIAGGILIAVGLVMAVTAFSRWAMTGYGDLIPESMMRLTIPSWTLMILGFQAVGNGFFMGVLHENDKSKGQETKK